MLTVIESNSKQVVIGGNNPFVIIGERINPTGRKKLAAKIVENDMEYIQKLAIDQEAWGADILDINIGVPAIDEVAMMSRAVTMVASVCHAPLCLDSADLAVLRAGLYVAPGKPLVNSVSGETKKMKDILPLVKERNAAVIGLTIDDNGIPNTPEDRIAIAERILNSAVRIGIPPEDIVIDPIVMTVASDSKAALITLQTIELLRKSLEVNICVGASNVSFGLPERPVLNQAFLVLCIQAGATCAITDPEKMGQTVRASDLLLGRDDNSIRYLKYYRTAEKKRKENDAA